MPQPCDTALRTIQITPAELQRTERKAYERGFAVGRAYERLHGTTPETSAPQIPSADEPDTNIAQPVPQPAPHLPTKSSSPPPAATQSGPILPSPPPAYSASGPARPLTP